RPRQGAPPADSTQKQAEPGQPAAKGIEPAEGISEKPTAQTPGPAKEKPREPAAGESKTDREKPQEPDAAEAGPTSGRGGRALGKVLKRVMKESSEPDAGEAPPFR
ncbi:MAG: hypothetical protein ABIK89_24165, partial [Planctomycetota bacterium]